MATVGLGTDLVFRDNDGLIWAVQAMCYSEHRSTTKGDMNSFLADTGRPEVDKLLGLQSKCQAVLLWYEKEVAE